MVEPGYVGLAQESPGFAPVLDMGAAISAFAIDAKDLGINVDQDCAELCADMSALDTCSNATCKNVINSIAGESLASKGVEDQFVQVSFHSAAPKIG